MNIANKLTQIAENQQRVYDAGVEEGKQAEQDSFWEAFQKTYKGDERTDYSHAFRGASGVGWNATTFKPKYDLRPTNAAYMFYYFSSGYVVSLVDMLQQSGVVLDTSQCTNHNYMFANAPITDVPHIDLTKSTNMQYLFYTCLYLKKAAITLAENTASSYTGMFGACQQLTDLTINGTADKSLDLKYSSKLTDVSVQSVIDALKDLTGAATQTLTFHATVGAALTDAQKATITAKNWTLAY